MNPKEKGPKGRYLGTHGKNSEVFVLTAVTCFYPPAFFLLGHIDVLVNLYPVGFGFSFGPRSRIAALLSDDRWWFIIDIQVVVIIVDNLVYMYGSLSLRSLLRRHRKLYKPKLANTICEAILASVTLVQVPNLPLNKKSPD